MGLQKFICDISQDLFFSIPANLITLVTCLTFMKISIQIYLCEYYWFLKSKWPTLSQINAGNNKNKNDDSHLYYLL